MGKYINKIGTTFEEKVTNLKNNHKAVETDSSFKKDLVCVVDNGPFAAAGYMYDKEERDDFATFDGRKKMWLIVPNAESLVDK